MTSLDYLTDTIRDALREARELEIPEGKWPLAVARKLVDTGTVKLAENANVVRATIGGEEKRVRITGWDPGIRMLTYENIEGVGFGLIPIAAVAREDNYKLADIIGNVATTQPPGGEAPTVWHGGKVSLGELQGKQGSD